ncbi:Acetyltransferase (GNAT) domain-containing protein [Devosia sp. YR412]|uniref:GNAT family N-acetyltransferase n=1 Tax=Devosia sp. YR412 TaxID=1881030 RepID=UPI0008ABF7DB|nr:GNAT family N-acetyltransferase [Devosia sp. YR412]SEQ02483.1 Acetyltransferase (GNAT) domain-containing protein [Devosia sp. YR412]
MIEIVSDPNPEDAALRALWLSAWGDGGPESFAKILTHGLGHVGAFDGKRLIGFVNIAWDGGVHAFILDTCVHADYQRQGIALRLLERAEQLARQRGALWLHVDFEARLEGFYRKAGFAPTAAGLKRLA